MVRCVVSGLVRSESQWRVDERGGTFLCVGLQISAFSPNCPKLQSHLSFTHHHPPTRRTVTTTARGP